MFRALWTTVETRKNHFTKAGLTLRKQIITLKVIVECMIDTLFINFAENWEKRHWSIIID